MAESSSRDGESGRANDALGTGAEVLPAQAFHHVTEAFIRRSATCTAIDGSCEILQGLRRDS